MTDETSLINVGELARPATVLIEKISGAVATLYEPYQIIRVARAEAEAHKIEAIARIEVTEFKHRALTRFFAEELKKQHNMESIISKTLPQLQEDARPQDLDDDWIANFFDKCRLISDDKMQELWARLLAGEANSPGRFSRRTVNLLNALDKSDAVVFTKLCGFRWSICGHATPLVLDAEARIYLDNGISAGVLHELDTAGLITFHPLRGGGYQETISADSIHVFYYGTQVEIKANEKRSASPDFTLPLGKVRFSRSGRELADICGSAPVPRSLDYVVQAWSKQGLNVSFTASTSDELPLEPNR